MRRNLVPNNFGCSVMVAMWPMYMSVADFLWCSCPYFHNLTTEMQCLTGQWMIKIHLYCRIADTHDSAFEPSPLVILERDDVPFEENFVSLWPLPKNIPVYFENRFGIEWPVAFLVIKGKGIIAAFFQTIDIVIECR